MANEKQRDSWMEKASGKSGVVVVRMCGDGVMIE